MSYWTRFFIVFCICQQTQSP